MQELRRICDQNGILLVADEVQSGVARTGKWWAIEHSGVEPDMVCIAKGIASGMPLGITMTRAEIMDWVPGSHASTFGGNPVCVAAALATLDVIEKEKLVKHSGEVGAHMMKRMVSWPKDRKLVGDVRGRGLMIGVDIVKDKATKEYGAAERDVIIEKAFEQGILFLGCGPSSIRLCPPLVVTKEQADVAMDVLEECIRQVGGE
jgi:4-aminobutyrate aminotransferase